MIEVFKTNVTSPVIAEIVLRELNKRFSFAKLNFDLNDCDNILRVEAETINAEEMVLVLESLNIKAQVLE